MREAQKQRGLGMSQIIMMRQAQRKDTKEGSIMELFSASCPPPVPERVAQSDSDRMRAAGGGEQGQHQSEGKKRGGEGTALDKDNMPQPVAHSWGEEGIRLHLTPVVPGRAAEHAEPTAAETAARAERVEWREQIAEAAQQKQSDEVREQLAEFELQEKLSPIDRITPSFLGEQQQVGQAALHRVVCKLRASLEGQDILAAFAVFDEDGSGDVDQDELRRAVVSMGLSLTYAELGQVMYHLGGGGAITAKSFAHFVEDSAAACSSPPLRLLNGGSASPDKSRRKRWQPARMTDPGAVLHFDSPQHERAPVEIYLDDL
jgi:calmodulin